MFSKIVNLALVFILSIINIIIMLVPLALILSPMIYALYYYNYQYNYTLKLYLYFFLSVTVLAIISYMLVYMVSDFLFGLTVRSYSKGAIPISKAGFLNGHKEIEQAFNYLKKRFNLQNVELLISPSLVINAYAIGSMRKKAIVITVGLANNIHNNSVNDHQYVDMLAAILGHEFSHLVNKDFLPGMLIYSNQKISNGLSWIFANIFISLANILRIIPIIGKPIALLLSLIYKIVNKALNLFYKLVFLPVYNFIYKWFSRSIEYRCDKDAAKIFGGKNMANALKTLGKGSYFSIFSTHPKTAARVNHVQNISPTAGIIKPSFLGQLVNIITIIIPIYFAYVLYGWVKVYIAYFMVH